MKIKYHNIKKPTEKKQQNAIPDIFYNNGFTIKGQA